MDGWTSFGHLIVSPFALAEKMEEEEEAKAISQNHRWLSSGQQLDKKCFEWLFPPREKLMGETRVLLCVIERDQFWPGATEEDCEGMRMKRPQSKKIEATYDACYSSATYNPLKVGDSEKEKGRTRREMGRRMSQR